MSKGDERRFRPFFRERAREIIYRDRSARKFGRSQNTIGEIERAMAEAFRLGQAALVSNPAATEEGEGIIDWIEIPPRARDLLSIITFCLPDEIERDESRSTLERIRVDGKERWQSVANRGRSDALTYSTGAVTPLIKLRLLEALRGNPDVLTLTGKGVRTTDEYWRRRAVGDRTLPLENARV